MKKMLTILVILVMVMSLTLTAQAEVHMTHFGEELNDNGSYDKYVVLESDTGDEMKLKVTDEELERYLTEMFEAKEAKRRSENPTKWEAFVDTISFWN